MHTKTIKRLLFILVVIIIGITIGYNYLYQDHRNIEVEKPDFKVSAKAITDSFINQPEISETKYLNKTIEISGIVTEFNKNDVTVDNTVFCQFNTDINYALNEKIKIKGRLIGYDDLLEIIKLDQCISITD
ncbi:hypothetical protein [uncultured Algibacter sp.]|uniref:OB-fold protein n=1 Tax=uncultured Algibacter sp. TaxID=298659 RepID=UPI0032169431